MGVDIVLYDGRVLKVMEGDAEHAELLRGIRGGGASTFGVVTRMYLRLYPESRVEAFFYAGPTGEVYGLGGAREIEDFASDLPPNISFFFKQQVEQNGATSTLLYVACHGSTTTCRSSLRGLRLTGTLRSYRSHYSYMTGVLGAEKRESDLTTYFASMAIPESSLRGGRSNALAYIERFLTTIPRGYNFSYAACTLRPIGGAAARNDPDGELTSVSTQFRRSVLFGVCRASWSGEPPEGATDWIDTFYERYMRPIGTPDGWQYANEGSHNLPGWEQRYWNGQSGYDRMMAVKQAYDPLTVFTGWHMPGSSGSAVMQDAYFCPAVCRSQRRGCTNMPESFTCAPRPSYTSRRGSADPGPSDCDASACSHSITIELESDGRYPPPGFWLTMMTPDASPSAKCGPVSGQPELVEAYQMPGEISFFETRVTVDNICGGATYQLGVYFDTDDVRGRPCCSDGGFKAYYDGTLIFGGVDYHTVYTFTAPDDVTACPALVSSGTCSGCADQAVSGGGESSPPPPIGLRATKRTTSDSKMRDPLPRVVARGDDAAVVSLLATLLGNAPAGVIRAAADVLRGYVRGYSPGGLLWDEGDGAPVELRGLALCDIIALSSPPQPVSTSGAVRSRADVIRVEVLRDDCQSEEALRQSVTAMHRTGERGVEDYEMGMDSRNSTVILHGITARTRLDLEASGWSQVDETVIVDIFNLADSDGDGLLTEDELERSLRLFVAATTGGAGPVASRGGGAAVVRRGDLAQRPPPGFRSTTVVAQRAAQFSTTITHTREASADPLCVLPAVTFQTQCSNCGGGGGGGGGGGDDLDDRIDQGCFDANSLVLMADGKSEKRLADLAIGDRVATLVESESPRLTLSSSPVLAFAHRDAETSPGGDAGAGTAVLLEVHVRLGEGRGARRSLKLTPNHMIPVALRDSEDRAIGTRMIAAGDLRVGMLVTAVDPEGMPGAGGGNGVVVRIDETVRARGSVQLIAPMTMANTLIIDGIAVSCATEGMFLSSRSSSGYGGISSFSTATRDWLLEALLSPVYAYVLLVSSPVADWAAHRLVEGWKLQPPTSRWDWDARVRALISGAAPRNTVLLQ